MDNECLYLCSKASTSSMGALKCIALSLLLLRLLCFIINVHNKCVMFTLIVISGNEDPMLFFDLSLTQPTIANELRYHVSLFCVDNLLRLWCE